MEEQEHFIRVQITVELNLYNGRLAMPLNKNSNYLIYFKDQFTKLWTEESQLRPGEYIYLVDEQILPPE